MLLQYSDAVRNAQLEAWETAIGAGAIFRLYAEVATANVAAAAPATCIAEGTLTGDWSGAAAAGVKNMINGPFTVTGLAAAGAGTNAQSYRIYAADGTTCHEQGDVGITGSNNACTLDNPNIAEAQVLNVNTIQRQAGNA